MNRLTGQNLSANVSSTWLGLTANLSLAEIRYLPVSKTGDGSGRKRTGAVSFLHPLFSVSALAEQPFGLTTPKNFHLTENLKAARVPGVRQSNREVAMKIIVSYDSNNMLERPSATLLDDNGKVIDVELEIRDYGTGKEVDENGWYYETVTTGR